MTKLSKENSIKLEVFKAALKDYLIHFDNQPEEQLAIVTEELKTVFAENRTARQMFAREN